MAQAEQTLKREHASTYALKHPLLEFSFTTRFGVNFGRPKQSRNNLLPTLFFCGVLNIVTLGSLIFGVATVSPPNRVIFPIEKVVSRPTQGVSWSLGTSRGCRVPRIPGAGGRGACGRPSQTPDFASLARICEMEKGEAVRGWRGGCTQRCQHMRKSDLCRRWWLRLRGCARVASERRICKGHVFSTTSFLFVCQMRFCLGRWQNPETASVRVPRRLNLTAVVCGMHCSEPCQRRQSSRGCDGDVDVEHVPL